MLIKNKYLNLKKNNSIKNSQAYWESYSIQVPDGYKDHWIDDDGKPLSEEIYKEVSDFVIDKLGNDSDQKYILEVGCGTGKILSNIEKNYNSKNIFGIDFSLNQINVAKKNCSKCILFNNDLQSFKNENPEIYAKGFDLIFLHSVTQYFPSEQYFDDFLNLVFEGLKVNGILLIIDMPIVWYKEYMYGSSEKNTSYVLFKKFVKSILYKLKFKKYFDKFLKFKNRSSNLQTEEIGNKQITVPKFEGFWADPLKIEKFAENRFKKYELIYQPFKNKPITGKRFRPIAILSGKF